MARQFEEKKFEGLAGLQLGSTIAARQLKYALLLALFLGFVILTIRGYQDYNWLNSVFQQSKQRIISSSTPIARQVLLRGDEELADVLARGILNNRSISCVNLTNADGTFTFERKRRAGEIPTSRWAETMFGGIHTVSIAVHDMRGNSIVTIGEMVIDFNPQVYVNAYMSRLAWSFLATMVLAVVMAICFAGVSYFVFSRPVIRLGNYIVNSDPTDESRPLMMPPEHRHDDEVQLLGSVTVGLFGMIRRQLVELRKTRDELQDANINLEKRVEQRTRELNIAMRKLEVLASTDPLTELPNRRAYLGRLDDAILVWRRRQTPVSIILLDIDRFKALNDTYGHQAGDAVLVAFADILKDALRSIDLPARIGGEEFAVLLPGEELEGAMILAERLRQGIEKASIAYGDTKLSFTASFGVAGLPSAEALKDLDPDIAKEFERLRGTDRADISGILYSLADQALYTAKETGRNRCKLADFKTVTEFKDMFPFNA
ncbi:GGDEF domain-containing protein [Thalassospira sp.]|uniref:GGDEF domain-containing protein n=1 Tax=Thalassospira sp. TaxID=1912094 RepID=UPI003AA809F0